MINFENVYLHSIAHIEPDRFISSDDIEKELSSLYNELKLPFGRIEMQTGINTRGVFDLLPSEIATRAAQKLFVDNDFNPRKVDLLIHGSVCRDMLEPSTASFIHQNLELKSECLSFDLSNACLGVVSAINTAGKMIDSGAIESALIVTGENSKALLESTIKNLLKIKPNRKEIKKYFANFTIGSAGVALLLTNKKENAIAKINSSYNLSQTKVAHLCRGNGDMNNLVMETDSETLMIEGIKLAKETVKDIELASFDHFICHQVGVMHRNYLYKELGMSLDKDHTTFDKYGNTGSAALPLTLSDAFHKNKFKKGDKVLLLGIGSGLHTSTMEMKWIN